MNKYIFYTHEGFSESLTGKECENLQILGFEEGDDTISAKKNLISSNPWIQELDFDSEMILTQQILSDENKKDIRNVIDYILPDEKKHLEESRAPDNPILVSLQKLKELVN